MGGCPACGVRPATCTSLCEWQRQHPAQLPHCASTIRDCPLFAQLQDEMDEMERDEAENARLREGDPLRVARERPGGAAGKVSGWEGLGGGF